MLEVGVPSATMHKDDVGCVRVFESVKLGSGRVVTFFLEVAHAETCGSAACARSAFHAAGRLAQRDLGRLILVERMHVGAVKGGILKPESATFTRVAVDDRSAAWRRVTSADWLAWVDQGLDLDAPMLLGEIDLPALVVSFEMAKRLLAMPSVVEWLQESDP